MNSAELMVVFLGFGIVFAVLAILFVVMVIMGAVSKSARKEEKAAEPAAQPKAAAPAPAPTAAAAPAGEDEAEIAAAITAALAVVMDVPVSAVRLRNFYEQPAIPTHYIVDDPWNKEGRVIEAWKPTYLNTDGGNRNEKLYSKDKWKAV